MDSPTSPVLQGPSAAEFMGVCIIAALISMVILSLTGYSGARIGSLYGFIVAQTYMYFVAYDEDPRWLKGSVFVIWVFETSHFIFTIFWLYHLLIEGFGDLRISENSTWSPTASIVLEEIAAGMIQSLYLRRLWILSHQNMSLMVPLAVVVFLRFATAIISAILLVTLGLFSEFGTISAPKAIADTSNFLRCTADALIAASMIYYLCRNKPASANIVYAGLFTIVTKLYANAFLGTLNGRQILRQRLNSGGIIPSTSDYYSTHIQAEAVKNHRLPLSSENQASSRTIEIYKEVTTVCRA
ncbi:hypothetical protein K474DRAFT_1677531 [Panus rudis PR-1116 ss-1]|nr:hypothetical protein K474DRAFT_1677531 [Panus rudis PR-1116 ss-1]